MELVFTAEEAMAILIGIPAGVMAGISAALVIRLVMNRGGANEKR